MQIKCPHCSTSFEVPGPGLHFCPTCGQQLPVRPDATSASVNPLSAYQPGQVSGQPPPGGAPPPVFEGREPTPWERLAELGVFQGAWQTWVQSMLRPQEFWAKVRPDLPWASSLMYAWLVYGISQVLQLPLFPLSNAFNARAMTQLQPVLDQYPFLEKILERSAGGSFTAAFGAFVVSMVFFPVGMIIGAALLHLLCMLFKASGNGFNATMRAYCYASSPLLLSWIPCIGVAAFLYTVIQGIWGIASLQQTSVGKAAAIVLVPLVLCCCCGLLAVYSVIAGAAMLFK